MTAPRRVRIGRLVLDGIEPTQRAAVVAGFQDELARLLTADPDRLPEGQLAPRTGTPDEVGRRAAAAVHAQVIAAC